jgi:predicted Holliday junction resolvase-like endonuclease
MEEINVIEILNKIGGLRIKCPNSECDGSFSPREGRLFDIRKPYPKYFQNVLNAELKKSGRELKSVQNDIVKTKGKIKELSQKKLQLKGKKITRPKEIKVITKRINIGQIIEKILPATNKFKFETKDCRTLFTPIDYVAFSGLSKNNAIDKVSFIEVKTGNATLQKVQRQVKGAIESGNIEVRTY